MADSNTLDKYVQLKTLNLQKGFIAANRSSGDWNITVIQLYFFFSLSLTCVKKEFHFPDTL